MDMNSAAPPVITVDAMQPDTNRPKFVSVLDPIEPAIAHVRQMLFRPFNLSKWLVIGFCAWLAQLGFRGGGSGGGGGNGQEWKGFNSISSQVEMVKNYFIYHLALIIFIAAIVIPIIIVLAVVMCWLRSRGQFMFVHCIAGNKAEIEVPWNKYSRHGNSLFIFKLIVAIIGIVTISIPIVILVFSIIATANGSLVPGLPGIILSALAFIIAGIVLGLINKFTDDFVVPIMFTQTASVTAAWKKFLSILGGNKARLLLYILFQIVISMVMGFIALAIYFLGCCCFCLSCCISILLVIPIINLFVMYIVVVILLPLSAFRRAYSLFYLRQFGPQFDVFIAPPLAAI